MLALCVLLLKFLLNVLLDFGVDKIASLQSLQKRHNNKNQHKFGCCNFCTFTNRNK